MVRNKLCWDANNAVGLLKHRKKSDWTGMSSIPPDPPLFCSKGFLNKSLADLCALERCEFWGVMVLYDPVSDGRIKSPNKTDLHLHLRSLRSVNPFDV